MVMAFGGGVLCGLDSERTGLAAQFYSLGTVFITTDTLKTWRWNGSVWVDISAGFQFPIGAVYFSVTGTNPATELGYGTWAAFGAGKVPVGFLNADADFGVAEGTGGAKTHTHANHIVTQPSTHAALAAHAHELPFIKVAGGTGALRMLASSIFGTGTSRAPESVSAAPTALTTAAAVELSQAVSGGTPSAHAGTAVDAHDSPKHLMPYIVLYMWKRTA